MAAPRAKIDDGLLDIIILNKDISKVQVITITSIIIQGKHIKALVDYKTCKEHRIKS